MFDFNQLQAGDVLLYRGSSIFARIIQIKTFSRISHCEIYDGGYSVASRFSVASRDGIGVGRYPLKTNNLVAVLRPIGPFDVRKARRWFKEKADGQGYDWFGLLAFVSAKWQGRDNGKMFCSEFATRYLRAGGVDPFNNYDADGIAPGEFLKSAALVEIYNDENSVEAAA